MQPLKNTPTPKSATGPKHTSKPYVGAAEGCDPLIFNVQIKKQDQKIAACGSSYFEWFIHSLNVDHHGNKLQKASFADYGETSLWIANKRTT